MSIMVLMTGDELKSALIAANMRQADLARLSRRTPRHVNRWAQGDIEIPALVDVVMTLLSKRPELKQIISDRLERK